MNRTVADGTSRSQRTGKSLATCCALYQLALTLDVPVQYFFDGLSRRDKKRG
jgi:hypothetical protein